MKKTFFIRAHEWIPNTMSKMSWRWGKTFSFIQMKKLEIHQKNIFCFISFHGNRNSFFWRLKLIRKMFINCTFEIVVQIFFSRILWQTGHQAAHNLLEISKQQAHTDRLFETKQLLSAYLCRTNENGKFSFWAKQHFLQSMRFIFSTITLSFRALI